MANPNIVATSAIYGRTDVLAVPTSAAAITTNAAGSGKVLKINSLTVANVTGGQSVDVSVDLFRDGTPYHLAYLLSVPVDATVVAISKENPIYLQEGDSLRVAAQSADAAEAVCSYEEIS